MESKSRLSCKLDEPGVHLDSYTASWTAENSLPKIINSVVSYLLQSRFDGLGKFVRESTISVHTENFLTVLEM